MADLPFPIPAWFLPSCLHARIYPNSWVSARMHARVRRWLCVCVCVDAFSRRVLYTSGVCVCVDAFSRRVPYPGGVWVSVWPLSDFSRRVPYTRGVWVDAYVCVCACVCAPNNNIYTYLSSLRPVCPRAVMTTVGEDSPKATCHHCINSFIHRKT